MFYTSAQASKMIDCPTCNEPVLDNVIAHRSQRAHDSSMHIIHRQKGFMRHSKKCRVCEIITDADNLRSTSQSRISLKEEIKELTILFFKEQYENMSLRTITIGSIALGLLFCENLTLENKDFINYNFSIPLALGSVSTLLIHLFKQKVGDPESYISGLNFVCCFHGLITVYALVDSFANSSSVVKLEQNVLGAEKNSINLLLNCPNFINFNSTNLCMILAAKTTNFLVSKFL
jgi:hypothetical protein